MKRKFTILLPDITESLKRMNIELQKLKDSLGRFSEEMNTIIESNPDLQLDDDGE